MVEAERKSRATMTYTWPSNDPQYWQDLVEYVIEADGERNIPATAQDFLIDFVTYVEAKKRPKASADEILGKINEILYSFMENEIEDESALARIKELVQ